MYGRFGWEVAYVLAKVNGYWTVASSGSRRREAVKTEPEECLSL